MNADLREIYGGPTRAAAEAADDGGILFRSPAGHVILVHFFID
jgi:hypothetical protein